MPRRDKKAAQPPSSAPEKPAAVAKLSVPAPPSDTPKSSKPSQAYASDHVKKTNSGGISEWFSDKDKRNWVILVGGLLLTAIIVPLAMSGGSEAEDKKTTEEIVESELVAPIEGAASSPSEDELTDEANAADSQPPRGE